MYSHGQPTELAPAEDQGVIFGVVETPPDATIEQTSFYVDIAGRSFAKVPEREQVFQLTFPDSGFGGLVLKPWGERKRTAFQIVPGSAGDGEQYSRHPHVHGHAAAAAHRR